MLILVIFCAELLLCVLLNASIIYALLIGLGLFLLYGKKQGFQWKQLWLMMLSGVSTAKSILTVFFLIGVLTAIWRACGTIPLIICHAVDLIHPNTLLIASFLLNCAVSVLTGTAFGTAATMGTVCMTAALSMGISPVLAGGAILSGVYFGDRCSPVSTSALLIGKLTKTNIYKNIRRMLQTALAPFLLSCVLYLISGLTIGNTGETMNLWPLFRQESNLHWVALLPAVLLLTLTLMRIDVKLAMLASIVSAFLLCLFLQGFSVSRTLYFSIWGYTANNESAAAMLNGGGVISMLQVAAIVCISSSYSGIFQATGLLDGIKAKIVYLGNHATPFGAMLLTSIIASAVACNQTLTIMLTHQICENTEPNPQTLAIDLENTAVVIAPLIPWSIAGAVPLASAGAPLSSILSAYFLYLLPFMMLCKKLWNRQ